jgi:hypothetical protein
MADKQTIEKYLGIDYLQKKVGETSGVDYRKKFEANFDSLDRSAQDSVKEALEHALHLSPLQQQAFTALIAYAAFGASDMKPEHALSGLVPPDYKLDGPVENQDPRFAAVQHDALYAFLKAQKARQHHPGDSDDSRRAAFQETLSLMTKDIGEYDPFHSRINFGIPLLTGAPRPGEKPIEAQDGGPFGTAYQSTPSFGLAYAFGEAAKEANLKVNSLAPGLAPQGQIGQRANDVGQPVQENQADLSPAREQFRLLTQEVNNSVRGIGNSQVAT